MLNHYHILDHEIYTERLAKHGMQLVDYSYCISRSTMELWDKIAVLSYFGRICKRDLNKDLTKHYRGLLKRIVEKEYCNKEMHANLLILAQKL